MFGFQMIMLLIVVGFLIWDAQRLFDEVIPKKPATTSFRLMTGGGNRPANIDTGDTGGGGGNPSQPKQTPAILPPPITRKKTIPSLLRNNLRHIRLFRVFAVLLCLDISVIAYTCMTTSMRVVVTMTEHDCNILSGRLLPLVWGIAQTLAFVLLVSRIFVMAPVVRQEWKAIHDRLVHVTIIMVGSIPALTLFGIAFWGGLLNEQNRCVMFGPMWITIFFVCGSVVLSILFGILFVLPLLQYSSSARAKTAIGERHSRQLRNVAMWNLCLAASVLGITVIDMIFISVAGSNQPGNMILRDYSALAADIEIFIVLVLLHMPTKPAFALNRHMKNFVPLLISRNTSSGKAGLAPLGGGGRRNFTAGEDRRIFAEMGADHRPESAPTMPVDEISSDANVIMFATVRT